MIKLRTNRAAAISALCTAVFQWRSREYSTIRASKALQSATACHSETRNPFARHFLCQGKVSQEHKERRYHVCQVTEAHVLDLAKAGNVSKAVMVATQSLEKGLTVSPKCATVLIATLSQAGSIDGVLQVSRLVKTTAPNFWYQHIGFEHYYAEAMYRSGDVEGSIKKFDALFRNHHHLREKISNLMSFLAIYLTSKSLETEIELLSERCCALANDGYYQPLVNVWRIFFTSSNSRHHVAAWTLMRGRLDAKVFVERKIDGILKTAIDKDDIDIVHRLLEVILHLEMEACYTKLFSMLLEFYCDGNDIRNAQATFDHAQSRKIGLYPATFYRYTCFLSLHSLRIPQDVLSMKYPSTKIPKGPKFRF